VGLRRLIMFLSACGALVAALALPALASADDSGQLGPKPAMCGIGCWGDGTTLDESRLGYYTLNPSIVHVGQKVTAHWIALDTDGISWTWPFHGKGCQKQNSPTCVFKATTPTGGWSTVTIGIGNPIGPADSQNAYAVIGDDQSVIDGYVNDQTGGGVGGVSIDVTGAHRYHATTGADGFFSIIVKAGSYAVTADGGPGKNPRLKPKVNRLTLHNGDTGSADFTLENGLQVSLKLSQDSVPADGHQVVTGTITATKYGKPAAGQPISLQGLGLTQDSPRGTVCEAGGRIWPGGAINDINDAPVTVTTGSDGKYSFQIQVGTVPGAFKIQAWAQDAFGQDITDDISDARDEATLQEESLGSHSTASFLSALDSLANSPATAGADDSAYDDYQLFTKLTTKGSLFGGMAYGYVGSDIGQSELLIYDAAKPPKLRANGDVVDAGASVIPVSEWVGATDLGIELETGKLLGPLPTLGQWGLGKTVSLWQMQKATALLPSGAFEGYGWGYPGATGGCE
jgi:hypothetical protein